MTTRIRVAALAMALATGPAVAADADAPWLDVQQDGDAVRFTSQIDDDAFSFRIPGQLAHQAVDDQFVDATVDGAAFAFHVLWTNPDQDTLAAVTDGAKANAVKLGAAVGPSAECAMAKGVHREWAVTEARTGTRTIVVAFEIASGALAMRVVDDAGKAGRGKLRAACASFARGGDDEAGAKAGPGGDKEKPGAD